MQEELNLSDSCYSGQAKADKTTEANFFIEMNTATGEVLETCTYATTADAPGCKMTTLSDGSKTYTW